MEKFNKPEKLNGNQLTKELSAIGIEMLIEPTIDGDGFLLLDVTKKDASKVEAIVNKHVGIDEIDELQLKKEAVLTKLGLTADEVAALLA